MKHHPEPPELTAIELGNRAPCVGCGEGLVACLISGTNLVMWEGGPEAIYWRHDRQRRALIPAREYGGLRLWELAPDDEQFGPKGAIHHANMRDFGPIGRNDR